MRVKISYTVELEQVEREVAKIMKKATEELDHACHEVVGLHHLLETQTGDMNQSLESIDFARKKMMKADQVLEDCYSILQGYRNALKQIEEQENEIETR
jgi:hypothetical protein